MKILATGGLGAVGSPLVALLRQEGNEVWVLDRPHHHGLDGKYYFRGDIGHYRQLERLFDAHKFDLVYNLAAEFGRLNGEDFYETMWQSNAIGTKNIIRLQEKHGFRLVHFSSSEVYGDYEGVMAEEVTDTVPIKQMNDYAISKWVNEMQIINSQSTRATETVRVRLFNTYGPGETYSDYRSVVCLFIYRALVGIPYTVYLDHHRTFTWIDDCASALSRIATNFKPGEVYNIAGTSYYDIKAASDMILKQLHLNDSNVQYLTKEKHNTLDKRTDASKAIRDLGMRESISLEEGIAKTIAWQKSYYGL
jgi:dTDP-glucose 4,6-dehydratase